TAIGQDESRWIRARRQQEREVVVVEQPRWLGAVGAAELVEVVPRQQEHAVLVPLEALPGSVRAPDRGRPAALGNEDNLVERQPHRGQHAARWDFGHPRLGDALRAFELDERRVTAALLPPT